MLNRTDSRPKITAVREKTLPALETYCKSHVFSRLYPVITLNHRLFSRLSLSAGAMPPAHGSESLWPPGAAALVPNQQRVLAAQRWPRAQPLGPQQHLVLVRGARPVQHGHLHRSHDPGKALPAPRHQHWQSFGERWLLKMSFHRWKIFLGFTDNLNFAWFPFLFHCIFGFSSLESILFCWLYDLFACLL